MSTTARLRSEAGYSLIELLVSSAIMITVTGAIFSLVNPSQGTSQTVPEISDLQQRARVGSDVLFKEIVDGRRWHLSGAGALAARQFLLTDSAAARRAHRARPVQRVQDRRHHGDLHPEHVLADDDQQLDADRIPTS